MQSPVQWPGVGTCDSDDRGCHIKVCLPDRFDHSMLCPSKSGATFPKPVLIQEWGSASQALRLCLNFMELSCQC